MAAPHFIRPSLKGNVEEALRLFSSDAEWGGLTLAETEFVLEETLKCYGSTYDADMIRSLLKFYRRYVSMSDVARRQGLLTRITEFVSNGHRNRFIALLCFLSADNDGQIISGAALDMAMVIPHEPANPLAGPEYVAWHGCGGVRAKMGIGEASDDEGYVAAGLLLLGDMRLMPLLEEVWGRLTPGARRNMLARRSNLATRMNIEFILIRLHEDKDEEYHGELAAFLHDIPTLAAKMPVNAVVDIRRNFGLKPGMEPMELLAGMQIKEAFDYIKEPLKLLIKRESEPRVLMNVWHVWKKAAASNEPDPEIEDEVEEAYEEDASESKTLIISDDLHREFENSKFSSEAHNRTPLISFWNNPYEGTSISSAELLKVFSMGKIFPIFITGIFNPVGPTITVYTLRKTDGGWWAMERYQLNPFTCCVGCIGGLELDKVELEFGKLDGDKSYKAGLPVFNGRNGGSVDHVHDVISRKVLGASKLQPTFTLYHNSKYVSADKLRERVACILMATPNARSVLDDLRNREKCSDPWARVGFAEAVKRAMSPPVEHALLTNAEALELAEIILRPEQQLIEMENLLAAWRGAIEFNSALKPVLTAEDLIITLGSMMVDMPKLLKL